MKASHVYCTRRLDSRFIIDLFLIFTIFRRLISFYVFRITFTFYDSKKYEKKLHFLLFHQLQLVQVLFFYSIDLNIILTFSFKLKLNDGITTFSEQNST